MIQLASVQCQLTKARHTSASPFFMSDENFPLLLQCRALRYGLVALRQNAHSSEAGPIRAAEHFSQLEEAGSETKSQCLHHEREIRPYKYRGEPSQRTHDQSTCSTLSARVCNIKQAPYESLHLRIQKA